MLGRECRAFSSNTSSQTLKDIPADVLSKARKMAPGVGLFAGIFGSCVGVGGGVLIVPTITSACPSIAQRIVSGTSLAAVLSTALASATVFSQGGCVDVGAAAVISPVAALMAPLGARLTMRLDCNALKRILGFFLLFVGPIVPLKSYLFAHNTTDDGSSDEDNGNEGNKEQQQSEKKSSQTPMDVPTIAILSATGAVAGLASGILGIGGGTVVTPLLALALPLTQSQVLGTSLLAMIPPSAAALFQHHRLGNVDWRMAAGLSLGTAVGAGAGSVAALKAPDGVLECIFALGMLFLGRKTLLGVKKKV